MRDVLWPGTVLGYCTNVHAGTTLEEVKQNLETHALAVKAQVSPDAPMGIGLWLAADVARELIENECVDELRDWLGERGLEVFTINGFPYGNFHEPVVKHKVYKPDWRDRKRLDYTLDLAVILARLLGDRREGSISTLPLGWQQLRPGELERAAENIHSLASELQIVEGNSGKLLHLDLEPEPGCTLGDLNAAVTWIAHDLMFGLFDERIRRHVRLCLDVCHAAVMWDDVAEVLHTMNDQGILIGKVQVSNAPRLDLRNMSHRERTDAIAQLQPFAEDCYLHQTTLRENNQQQFFDDLPAALKKFGQSDRAGDEWRIHYHVPIYLESFGLIGTTQDCIIECLRLLRDRNVAHWEIETYAWNVLPEELQHDTLADGIAQEFRWLIEQAEKVR